MAEWKELFRGVVFPWNCDHLGHMNEYGNNLLHGATSASQIDLKVNQ